MTDPRTRLLALDTCAVSDALDNLGLTGTVTGIVSVTGSRRIAGRAVTVRLGSPTSEELPRRHLCSRAIESAGTGDVIVVEQHVRPDAAAWGGLLSTAARQRGLAGTIVDGPVRDVDESRELSYPVFARSVVPFTARGRIVEQSWNEPITMDGVLVSPGDWVIADGSGVVFFAKEKAEEILVTAEAIASREKELAAAVASGRPVSEVLGGDYERMIRGKSSG